MKHTSFKKSFKERKLKYHARKEQTPIGVEAETDSS